MCMAFDKDENGKELLFAKEQQRAVVVVVVSFLLVFLPLDKSDAGNIRNKMKRNKKNKNSMAYKK